MTILADTIAANIIVEPTTGDIDLVVDSPVILVEVTPPAPVIVETTGSPGPKGDKGDKGDEGDEGDPGPPGLNALGAWNPTVNYVPDDLVTSNGSSWLAIAPSIGIDPGRDTTSTPVGSWIHTYYQSLGSNPYTCAVNFTVDVPMYVSAMNVASTFGSPSYAERIGLASALNVPGAGVQWMGSGTADSSGKVLLDQVATLHPGIEYWYVVYKPVTSNIMISGEGQYTATHMTWGGKFMYGLPEPTNDLGLYIMPVILYGTSGDDPWTLFVAKGQVDFASADLRYANIEGDTFTGPVQVANEDSGTESLTVRGAAGQVVPLQTWRDVGGVVKAEITPDGSMRVTNVLNGIIVRIPGIDLWNDGHIYFANQASNIWGTANDIRINKPLMLGNGATVSAGLWKGTQAEYEAITTKNPNTVYVVL